MAQTATYSGQSGVRVFAQPGNARVLPAAGQAPPPVYTVQDPCVTGAPRGAGVIVVG